MFSRTVITEAAGKVVAVGGPLVRAEEDEMVGAPRTHGEINTDLILVEEFGGKS